MDPLLGQSLLNRYRIEAFVGRGGMADVYKAFDIQRNAYVAIKLLREDVAQDLVFRRKFRREAIVLQTLNHPNIVRFYSFEEEGLLAFLVLEFIAGPPLRALIAAREGDPFSPEEALAYLEPICSALQYGHSEGVYHCDVKPGNILIEERTGRVLVSDFGIAKLAESATVTTSTPGTPAYMSPEQCRGQGVDQRTDVYSLAITLYEMVTGGERPFIGDRAPGEGSTGEKIRWEHMSAEPPSLRVHNAELPLQAEEVILKALAKNPDDRYGSVTDFVAAYRDALGEEVMVPPIRPVRLGPPPEPPKARARYAALGGLGATGAVILLVVVCIGGVLLIPRALPPNLAPTATQAPWVATASSATATKDNTPIRPTTTLTEYVQPTDTVPVPTSTYTPTPVPATATQISTPTAPKETPTPAPQPTSVPTRAASNHIAYYLSSGLYVMDPDGSNQRRLGGISESAYPGIPVPPQFAWSPDGLEIAFVTGAWIRQLLTADIGSGTLSMLIPECRCDYPSWSSATDTIVVANQEYISSVSRDGQFRRDAIARGVPRPSWFDPGGLQVAVSPDGTKVAFWRYDPEAEQYTFHLDVLTVQGTFVGRILTLHNDVQFFDWSPQGEKIAVYRDGNTIRIAKSDATQSTDIRCGVAGTESCSSETSLAWSPDGSKIAYVASSGGGDNREILVMNADGSGQRNLTKNPAADECPSWSPDGQKIAFSSWRDGHWEVYVMNANGSNQRRLTKTASGDARCPVWSPV